jgi:peptidyl-prolyl cis-trans isomerase B (cyclophilin B)
MSNPDQPPYPAQSGAPSPYSEPHPSQPYAGQPYPGQPYPGQPYPGQPYPGQPYPYAYAPRTNVLAIISLVSAFVMSIAAVITGHIALAQIKRTGESGRGLALAGLIIGYVGVAFTAIFFLVWLTFFFSIMGHSLSTSGISS